MTVLLQGLRSAIALAMALLWFLPAGLWLHLVVLPASWIAPHRTPALITAYVRMMAIVFMSLLRLGGAQFRWTGTIPTDAPCVIVGNHQSLVDVVPIVRMMDPRVPAFVARSRYAKVPVIGAAMRMARCPLVDPRRDREGAVAAVAEAARTLDNGLLIFPEGHRTLDGEIRPWRAAGLLAILAARRVPVYLVVTDGLWQSRTLADFVFGVHRLRGETEAMGPVVPPDDARELPAFVEGLREAMIERLAEMRRRHAAGA